MKTVVFMLSIAVICIGADARPARAGGQVFPIGSCLPGAQVRVASSCANGWEPSKIPWKVALSDKEQPKHVFSFKRDDAVEVVQTDPSRRLVKIKHGGVTSWVGADALHCDGRSVSGYLAPVDESELQMCPVVPLPVNPKTLKSTEKDAHAEYVDAILDKAKQYSYAVQRKVEHDVTALGKAYEVLSVDKKVETIEAAFKKVGEEYDRAKAVYGDECDKDLAESIGEIQRERGERMCRTFRDTYRALAKFMPAGSSDEVIKGFGELYDKEQFGTPVARNEQLFVRTAIFYGMGLDGGDLDPRKKQLRSSLKFARQSYEMAYLEAKTGKRSLGGANWELNNGYLYGGTGDPREGDAVDCAGFALGYVLGMKRKAVPGGKGPLPTVWDFNNIARARAGEVSEAPFFGNYTHCFQVVNLAKGEAPMEGDFVSVKGHVVIVAGYDSDKRTIKTMEAASGDHGSVGDGERSLYEPSCSKNDTDWATRPILPDLRILRYAGGDGCPTAKEIRAAKR